jgi:hypothetical protein|tara:strand:+ start:243 stop:488 length:246 start_codon:yes stop_codon:yes gene_type:complete
MKKILLLTTLFLAFACSKDDEDSNECLICDSFGEGADMTQSELNGFCVGATAEDGSTVTKEAVEAMAALLNFFPGTDCSVR